MAYLYRHIRLDKNVPFYIGIGSSENYARAKDGVKRSILWKRIAAKGYEVEILIDGLTWEQACEKEKEFISIYGRIDLKTGTLANMTDGGDGMLNPSEDVRRALSRASTGKWHSQETKDRLRAMKIGIKHSPEAIKKMKEFQKGRNKGKDNGNYGKKQPDSAKAIMREKKLLIYLNEGNPAYKGIVQAYKDGELVGEYKGSGDCGIKLGIKKQGVLDCLCGRQKSHRGYTFKRLPND